MTQHSSGQLAPCISQTVSCAMPVLPSLSSSSVFCTVFFFPFSCKSFCLVEKMFQHSHTLHPFPLYSCSCCRWFSFTFLQLLFTDGIKSRIRNCEGICQIYTSFASSTEAHSCSCFQMVLQDFKFPCSEMFSHLQEKIYSSSREAMGLFC